MSNVLNVYWCPKFHTGENDWNILYEEPENLFIFMSKVKNESNKINNFLRCPATSDLMKNIFIIKSPLNSDAQATIQGDMLSPEVSSSNPNQPAWFINRPPSLSKNILISSSYSYLLFAEEEVEVSFTAPFFSDSPHMSYGAVVPGRFNVGSWFRPINLEFNLWEGRDKMVIKEGEPLAYLNFHTDKRVVLNRFMETQRLSDFAATNAQSTLWEPLVPLAKRYKRFRDTKMKKLILEEIKRNLV